MRERAIPLGHILTWTLCNEPRRVDTVRVTGPGIWEDAWLGSSRTVAAVSP